MTIDSDRKNVNKGKYVARVKTPTKKGVEVVIKGFRVGISSMKNVSFIQRSDAYACSNSHLSEVYHIELTADARR